MFRFENISEQFEDDGKEVFEVVFDSSYVNKKDKNGLVGIAVVENPAIQLPFVALSSKSNIKKVHFSENKQILTAPILVPGQLILRYDKKSDKEYYIRYSKTSLENILKNNALTQGLHQNINLEHTKKKIKAGVMEIWQSIDSKNDKSYKLFGDEFPSGTLFLSLYIADKKMYEYLKENKTGFSIEGYFDFEKVLSEYNATRITQKSHTVYNSNKVIKNMSFLDKLEKLFSQEKTKLANVVAYFIYNAETEEVTAVVVDEENNVFIADGSGNTVADGDYTAMNLIDDSRSDITIEGGKITTESEETSEEIVDDETVVEESANSERQNDNFSARSKNIKQEFNNKTKNTMSDKEKTELTSVLTKLAKQLDSLKSEVAELKSQAIKQSEVSKEVDDKTSASELINALEFFNGESKLSNDELKKAMIERRKQLFSQNSK